MENHNLKIGKIGEQKASTYLKNHGYTVIERNFYAKTGEIDIIAKKDGVFIFVEVKTRTQSEYGTPAEAVNFYKRKNIYDTAELYIMKKRIEADYRFDVIEVLLKKSVFGYIGKVNHIKNAFIKE